MNDVFEIISRGIKTKYTAIVGTVTAVDEPGLLCDVAPLDDANAVIFDVRLTAGSNGFAIIPAVNSKVIVMMISKEVGVVVAVDTVTKIIMNGGAEGGLIKVNELKTQLDKTNEMVTALANSLTGFIPVSSDGGAALKTYASGQLSGKSVGNWDSIENDKIIHG